jgi:CTP:molybdopterin cytidylyltransferase MocA
MTIAALVLAAGGGSRFGGEQHKLLTLYRGRPLVVGVLEAAAAAGFDAAAVVSGAVPLDDLVPANMVLLHNPDWESGLASSLQVGLRWCRAAGHEAVVIGLGDMPGVPASAWTAVGASGAEVAVASFAGELRPPVRLARSVWDATPTSGDAGARALWHRPGTVEVPCVGDPADVDTTEDLNRLDQPT